VDRSNYCNANDIYLVDFFKRPGQSNDSQCETNLLCSSVNNFHNIPSEIFVTLHKTKLVSQFEMYELNHLYHSHCTPKVAI